MKIANYFKTDLHIHTNKSNVTKTNDYSGEFSIDELVKKLNENEIKLFSLTDHNIFNIEAYEEYEVKYGCDDNRKLLIGIELDVLKEENLIEELFNSKNELPKENIKYHAILIFKSNDINSLNKKLDKMYKNIEIDYMNEKGEKIYLSGSDIKSRSTSLERIVENFLDEDYLIIAHGSKSSSIIKTYKNELTTAQNMILLGIISSLEMGPTKADAADHYNKGFDKILSDEYKGRSDIPYVVFSDNHQLSAYPNYKVTQNIDGRPFTWIRGDLSFETLRLAFVDPLARIKFSNIYPENPPKYIEEIEFNLVNEKEKYNTVVNLSPGINSVVGGRSSGKSLLLNAILHNINTSREISEIHKYEDKDNKIIESKSILGKLNTEDSKMQINNCETIAYKQEDIVKLFEGKGKKLSAELPFIDFEPETINEELETSFSIIRELNSAYKSFYTNKMSFNVEFIKKDIQVSSQKSKRRFDIRTGVNFIESQIVEDPTITETKIERLDKSVKLLYEISKTKYSNKEIFDNSEISKLKEVIKIITEKEKYLIDEKRENVIKEIFSNGLNSKLPIYIKEYLDENDKIIESAKSRLDAEVIKAKDYFASIFQLRNAIENIDNLKFNKKSKIKPHSGNYDLQTDINLELSKEVFYDFISDNIANFDTLNPLKSLLALSEKNLWVKRKSNTPEDFSDLLNKFMGELRQKTKPKYSIIEKTENKNISSDHMSPGKKASIFLDIMLDNIQMNQEPHILIIDQPEDNLDNLFITENLIERFRELRGVVQTILVTHNAPIAINSDSDNIIIANNDGKIIQYTNGGLEDVEFRNEICKILDGGHYVFDKRYHKYDIPKRKMFEPISKEEES